MIQRILINPALAGSEVSVVVDSVIAALEVRGGQGVDAAYQHFPFLKVKYVRML